MAIQSAKAQSSVLDLGVRLQKDVGLYSENGISVNYSNQINFNFKHLSKNTHFMSQQS